MRKSVIIGVIILTLIGCGGEEGVINLSFPTIISLNKAKNILAIGDIYKGRVSIINIGAEKRLKEFSYHTALNIAPYNKGFIVFAQDGGVIHIYEITIDDEEVNQIETETISGILTGVTESNKGVWVSIYRDGNTEFQLYPELITSIPEMCTLFGVINDELFVICSGDVLKIIKSGITEIYSLSEASSVFPDPVSRTAIIAEGSNIKMLDRENDELIRLASLYAPVLSFIPLKERWIFLDTLGYARIMRRDNGCEIKHSTTEITESSGSIDVENIIIDDCTAITAEWKLEYQGELPGFPRNGRIIDENTLKDNSINFTESNIKEGYSLILSGNVSGEFTVASFDTHTIDIEETFPSYNTETTYSIRVNHILLTRDGEFIRADIRPGETISMPEITFTILPSSPVRGDYLILYSYEYGENMPFFISRYPLSVTWSSEEKVYILNPQSGIVSEVDFKALEVKRTFQ